MITGTYPGWFQVKPFSFFSSGHASNSAARILSISWALAHCLIQIKFHESWEILGASHTSREHNSHPTSNYLDSILNFRSNSFQIHASQFRLEYIRITSNSNSIHDYKSDSRFKFKFKSNSKTSYNHFKIENTTIISILKNIAGSQKKLRPHKLLGTLQHGVGKVLWHFGNVFMGSCEGMSALGFK